MIVFMTHDAALMWSRFERIAYVVGAVFLVMLMDLATGGSGSISLVIAFIGQLITLKCWLDMIFLRQPFKNCWEFKG